MNVEWTVISIQALRILVAKFDLPILRLRSMILAAPACFGGELAYLHKLCVEGSGGGSPF